MFKRINLRFPHFSLRKVLFSFLGLVILVLVAEGGYYLWRKGGLPIFSAKISPQILSKQTFTPEEIKAVIENPSLAKGLGVFFAEEGDFQGGKQRLRILGKINDMGNNWVTVERGGELVVVRIASDALVVEEFIDVYKVEKFKGLEAFQKLADKGDVVTFQELEVGKDGIIVGKSIGIVKRNI